MKYSIMGLGLLWFLFAQALVLQICLAQDGTVHNLHFVVDEVNITRMCTEQSLLTVNGSFPGPNITVTRGDTAIVSVQNNGEYPLTIHWHGVKQHRNPWSDGPENITQTPIQGGGGTFTYTIIFSDEEGTLWWHAHSDWTRASIYGAIIVLPPNEVYPFTKPDHTQTIILGSWFKGRDLMEEYLDAQRTGGDVNISDSFTINGYTGRNDTGCDLKDDIYTLKVERNKTYHLRIINAAMNEEMFFAISGHSFRVVGLDGAYLTPLLTNYIMITPGQTMDILLAANQTAGSYYMGGSAFADSSANSYDKSTTRAFLIYTDYNGTLVQDSLADLLAAPSNRSYADAFTKQLRGLKDNDDYPIKVPGHFDINKKFIITISTNTLPCDLDPQVENCTGPPLADGSSGMHSATLNNVRFRTKEIDILRAYYCNISGVYTEDFPHKPTAFNYTGDDTGDAEEDPIQGTRVISVQYGDAVEIVFQGTSVGNPENHPMHVHGYNLYLVGSDDGNFNSSSPNSYNLVDPPEVNTFGVPKKGWAAFRFWANNPGVWFLHCHLERHASWGMAGVLIVHNVTSDQDGILDPPAGYPKCSEPYPYL